MAPSERPLITLQLGPRAITGPWAIIALLVIIAGIAALLMYARPSPGMLCSGTLWLLFIVYWSAAAKNASPAKRSESLESRRLNQRLLNASLLLLFLPIPFLTGRYLPSGPWFVPAGLVVQVAFAFLAVWSRQHLGRNWSGAVTLAVDHQLVRSGPYRLLRHPIYTAMLGMSLGTAIVSGAFHALIGFALMAIAYGRKIRLEEQFLSENFGPEYGDYRRESWALIPWVF